jgi:hypothetical protein
MMTRPTFGRPETGEARVSFPESPIPGTRSRDPLAIIERCTYPAATRDRRSLFSAFPEDDPSRLPMFGDAAPADGDGTPCYRCVANHAPTGSGRVACHALRGTHRDGCGPEDLCRTV